MSTPNPASTEKRESSPDSRVEDKSHKERASFGPSTHRPSVAQSAAERARRNINAKLANPLQDYSYDELRKMGRAYAYEHALAEKDDVRALEIGACLARDPENLTHVKELGVTDEEYSVLAKEISHRWSQPTILYLVIVLCSTCAAVQGMGKLSLTRPRDATLTLLQMRRSSTERSSSTRANLASEATTRDRPGSSAS